MSRNNTTYVIFLKYWECSVTMVDQHDYLVDHCPIAFFYKHRTTAEPFVFTVNLNDYSEKLS